MDKDFISLYNVEITYTKALLGEFARRYPKAAASLRFDQLSIEDPHTGRLVESFAFLNAGVKSAIDDDHFELLRVLVSSHLLAPLPRLGIVRMSPDSQADAQRHLPKGTLLELPVDTCLHYYQTCFDTEVLPVYLHCFRYGSLSSQAPPLSAFSRVSEQKQALLSFKVSPIAEGETLEDIGVNRLRFFINGSPEIAFLFYEHLLSGLKGVAIARHAKDPEAIYLPASSLKPLSAHKDAVVLPIADQDQSVNRLLLDYFLLPEKFLFVELEGLLETNVWQTFSDGFTVYLYLSQHSLFLLNNINDDLLQLGCTPIINLFDDQSTLLDQKGELTDVLLESSSEIVGDISVFGIRGVEATQVANNERISLLPLNGATRYESLPTKVSLPYWQLHQSRPQDAHAQVGAPHLHFVDESGHEMPLPSGWSAKVSMQCMNRSTPRHLNLSNLRFSEAVGGVALSVSVFADQYEPLLFDNESLKVLLTQLTLQHFDGPDGLQALKNLLNLHNLRALDSAHKIIHSMQSLSMSSTTARLIIEGKARLMHGVHIHICCDYNTEFEGKMYILSQLLSEFFSCLCTNNTFTQLTLYNVNQSHTFEWPPVIGKVPLI